MIIACRYIAHYLRYKIWQESLANLYYKIIKWEVSKPFQLFRLYTISKQSTANVRTASKFFSSLLISRLYKISWCTWQRAIAVSTDIARYRRYSRMTIKKWRGPCPVGPPHWQKMGGSGPQECPHRIAAIDHTYSDGSGVNQEDIKKVFRLGKRKEVSESPRPLLVHLVSKDSVSPPSSEYTPLLCSR